MHACNNDFLETARMKIVERRHHAARLDAARSASRERDDTESAELIAPLLQLQEGARVAVQGDCGHFNWRFLFAEVRDHHAIARSRSDRALEVVEPAEANHSI